MISLLLTVALLLPVAQNVTFTPISADSTVNASIMGSLADYDETDSSTALEPNLDLQHGVSSNNISVHSAISGAFSLGGVPPSVIVSTGFSATTSGSTNDSDISYSYELTFSLDRTSLVSLVNGNSGAAFPRATASGVSSASLNYTLRHQAGATVFTYDAPTANSSGTYAQAIVPAGTYEFIVTGAASSPGDVCCVSQAGVTGGIVRLTFEDGDVVTYCTGKTTSQGCVPFLEAAGSGLPSVTDTNPFNIRGNDHVLSQGGILIYSFAKTNLDFHGGKLCVKSPIVRTVAKIAKTKAAVGCAGPASTGRLTTDFNNRIQNGFDPLLTGGQKVYAQWRQRDPTNTIGGFSDNLSNGIQFTILP